MRFPRQWRWAGSLALALAACAPQAPVVDLAAAEAAVRARGAALLAAEQARDIPAVMAFYAEDAILQPGGMPQVTGRAGLQGLFEGMVAAMGETGSYASTTTSIQVAASGDLAIEHGVNQFTVGGATTMGKYLAIWRLTGGEWLVSHLAFSDDQPMPASPPPAN